uniref:Iron-sulfur protein NUBPL n=1 Tax=Timema poppense TaxID=170557 RepID=A0A7R9DC64_TIMPO|nr:unnamed protein product [Timema poppensis]
MSMGFLVDEKSPVVWRGLMVMSAIDKLVRQVAWGPLDYLIVDTPPGTGDTHLSLIQNIPLSGVLLVTTPQTAALQVARRGIGLFQKLQVPVVGIVENMSSVTCAKCHHSTPIFGQGTAQMAAELVELNMTSTLANYATEAGVVNVNLVLGIRVKTIKQLAHHG